MAVVVCVDLCVYAGGAWVLQGRSLCKGVASAKWSQKETMWWRLVWHQSVCGENDSNKNKEVIRVLFFNRKSSSCVFFLLFLFSFSKKCGKGVGGRGGREFFEKNPKNYQNVNHQVCWVFLGFVVCESERKKDNMSQFMLSCHNLWKVVVGYHNFSEAIMTYGTLWWVIRTSQRLPELVTKRDQLSVEELRFEKLVQSSLEGFFFFEKKTNYALRRGLVCGASWHLQRNSHMWSVVVSSNSNVTITTAPCGLRLRDEHLRRRHQTHMQQRVNQRRGGGNCAWR